MRRGPPCCERTALTCLVPSRPFSRAPEVIHHAHLCQFWYGLCSCISSHPFVPHRPQGPANLVRPWNYGMRPRCWLRNIHLISIDYAFRPRLRSRLTLGGITFPRKPWAYGERDSHPSNRYSSRHIHLLTLHGPFPDRFTAPATLSYRSFEPAASAARLFPIIIGASLLDQ